MNAYHQHFATVDSTNTVARKLAASLPKEALLVVSADQQTKGRGRGNHSWNSPDCENIYCTFATFEKAPFAFMQNTSQFLSLLLCEELKSLGFAPRIKWPNDIILNGKKCAGLLCECFSEQSQVFLINGVGINVNIAKREVENIGNQATSLLIEGGKKMNRNAILQSLINAYENNYPKFQKAGLQPFLSMYKEFLIQEETLQFSHKGVRYKGAFHALNSDGTLSLKTESNEIITVSNLD